LTDPLDKGSIDSAPQPDENHAHDPHSPRHLGPEILGSLVEASLDGIVVIDRQGRYVYANPAASEIVGYPPQELAGRVFPLAPADRERETLRRRLEKGTSQRGPTIVVRPNGEEREIEFASVPIQVGDQSYTAGIMRDVTAVRRIEREGQALAGIASRAAFGGSVESTLDDICGYVVGATGAIAAAIVLIDRASGRRRMAGAHGLPDGYVAAANEVLSSGVRLLVQEAYERHKPAVVSDMRRRLLGSQDSAPLHPFAGEVEWDTVLSAPMVYQGEQIGVLHSYHPPGREISEVEIGFHTAIADQAAIAVENARLLAEVKEQATIEQRRHLARELHDSVSQALFSINLTAHGIESSLRKEGSGIHAALARIADLRQLTQGALAEMRALIFELRPGALEEEGLLQALRKHAAAIAGRELLQIDVLCPLEDRLPRLAPAAEEALYRIAQEAIHNVVKHARATHIEVALDLEGQALRLRISDNGRGFDPTQVPAGHMGLGTMAQRAAALGGDYSVQSAPGQGTTITVRVPLQEPPGG
jgi:PAS domain S-box-containing protein